MLRKAIKQRPDIYVYILALIIMLFSSSITTYARTLDEWASIANGRIGSNAKFVYWKNYNTDVDFIRGTTSATKSGNTTVITSNVHVEKNGDGILANANRSTSGNGCASVSRALVITFNGNHFRGYRTGENGTIFQFDNGTDFVIYWHETNNNIRSQHYDTSHGKDYTSWMSTYNSGKSDANKFKISLSGSEYGSGYGATYWCQSKFTITNLPSSVTDMYIVPITECGKESASESSGSMSNYMLDSSRFLNSSNGKVTFGYTVNFNSNGGSAATNRTEVTSMSLPSVSRTGYTFAGWYNGSTKVGNAGATYSPSANVTLTAHWTARTDTRYTVRHYQMNVNGSGYTLKDTDNLQGTTDTSVTPATKSYTGFTAPPTQTVNINADGSRVVDYYYSRNKYTFTLGTDASHYSHGVDTSGTSANGSYYYGATITLKASPKAGYTWSKWSDNNTSLSHTVTMPANNLTITPYATLITYTIRYNTYGGTINGTNTTTYNVETATFTLKNPTLSGRTFTGWSDWNNSTPKPTYTIPKGTTGDLIISANYDTNSSYPIYPGESYIKSNRFTIKM